MFDFLMESIVVSFALGAVVGAVVAPHLMRARQPSRERAGGGMEGDADLAKVPVRRE
jgi:hypothetical protein